MRTLAATLVVMPLLVLGVGCADDELDDLSSTDDALVTCDGWHRNADRHRGHKHRRHHHHHGHHHGKGGTSGGMAGTSGGMAGMSGTAGTSGGMAGMSGMAGTSGGGTGGTGGAPMDPRCAPLSNIASWWHGDGDFDDAVGMNDG